MKIRPLVADLLHKDIRANGWTDMTKLTVLFLSLRTRLKPATRFLTFESQWLT